MKKFLALVLALSMMLSCVAFAEEVASTKENTLTIGNSEMNGDFIDGFGSNSYDASIKDLMWRWCSTYEPDTAGQYILNPQAVANLDITEDEAGNKTYTFTLAEDMVWSDGTSITAKDYVGAILWKASDEWTTAGATSAVGDGLLGYDAYLTGEAAEFPGVKLIDDYSFSVTIDAAELPYYFEYVWAAFAPIPMHVWAPELTIAENENGSYLEGDMLAAMNNVGATERYAPTVVCGPYTFVSFENNTATLKRNPLFKGDLDGNKPTIEYVVQKTIAMDTDVDTLIAGDVDMVPGVIEGKKIETARSSGIINMHSYLRNGFGLMAMHCDWGPTADANVRWALAYLLDRNEVCNYVLEGYGGTVHASYGYAQWMYEYAGEDLESELTAFNLNIEKANELLDQTEWKYEADGTTPFDASKANAEGTYMRHNAAGEMLTIQHLGTDENTVTDIIEIQYAANAPMAGVNFVVTKSDFNALLDNFYYGYELGEDRYYSTFNLATSFAVIFDPYEEWHSDYFGTWSNSCQLSDEELDGYIMAMRTATTDDEYVDAWIQFQLRWQELMPEIPLYSNEYFDICSQYVDGLATTPFAGYEDVICKMTKSVG